jgi:hypothetical protein
MLIESGCLRHIDAGAVELLPRVVISSHQRQNKSTRLMSAPAMPSSGSVVHSAALACAALNHDRAGRYCEELSGSLCLPSTPKLYTLRRACAVCVISDEGFGGRTWCVPEPLASRSAGEMNWVGVEGTHTHDDRRQHSTQYAFITSTGLPQTPNHN